MVTYASFVVEERFLGKATVQERGFLKDEEAISVIVNNSVGKRSGLSNEDINWLLDDPVREELWQGIMERLKLVAVFWLQKNPKFVETGRKVKNAGSKI